MAHVAIAVDSPLLGAGPPIPKQRPRLAAAELFPRHSPSAAGWLLQGHVQNMAANEWGHVVLCMALSCVDDTALLSKTLVPELKVSTLSGGPWNAYRPGQA